MADRLRLHWPVDSRVITQRFGENPRIYAKFNLPGHEGVDLRAPVGANVYACADGEVFRVRPNDGNAYGLQVRIRHRAGAREYRTVYGHLSQVLVSEDEQVVAGQRIALAGNTGHSFAAHLHLTLKLVGAKTPGYPDGIIDPLPYMRAGEAPEPSDLVIYTTARLRLRAGPTTASAQLALLEQGEALTVLGDADAARASVGQYREWIQVRRADGMDGFVAAWYVQLKPFTPGTLVVYAAEPVYLRVGPSTTAAALAWLEQGEALTGLGDADAARAKVGQYDRWIRVERADGTEGFVAAWYVQFDPLVPKLPELMPEPEADGPVIVYATQPLYVRLGPSSGSSRIAIAMPHEPLTVVGNRQAALAQLGDRGAWLHVRLPDPAPDSEGRGPTGYAAAWYVQTEPGPPPRPALTVYPTEDTTLRQRPTVRAKMTVRLAKNVPLAVHDDPSRARALVGWYDCWLYVETPEGQRGWVPAWYISAMPV